jgi:hypothetical protein
VAAGGLLVLFACTFFRDYVAMDDPQWLGEAFMLAGLVLLLRAHGNAGVAGAALLVLAGGLTKHNLVALPVAVTLWLGWRDRRAGWVWLGTAVAGLAVAAGALALAYGPAVFADILAHARVYQPGGMAKGAGRLLPLLPLGVAAGVVLRGRWREPAVALAVLFAAVALVTGIAQRAGAGVAINAQFETLVAACLLGGVTLDRVAPAGRGVVLAAMLAPVLIVLPRRLPHGWQDWRGVAAREAAWRPAIARIAASPGPAACETLALCYWAGKPFAIDWFNLTQDMLVHGADARRLAPFGAHAFGVVQIVPGSPIHGGRGDPVTAAALAAYRPVADGPQGTVLLAPR